MRSETDHLQQHEEAPGTRQQAPADHERGPTLVVGGKLRGAPVRNNEPARRVLGREREILAGVTDACDVGVAAPKSDTDPSRDGTL